MMHGTTNIKYYFKLVSSVSKCAVIRTSRFKECDLLVYNSAVLGEWCHVPKEIISCIFKVSVAHHLGAPEALKIDVGNHLPNKTA